MIEKVSRTFWDRGSIILLPAFIITPPLRLDFPLYHGKSKLTGHNVSDLWLLVTV